jgi:hypothetical protein
MPVLLRFLRRVSRRARIACDYPASIKGTHKGHPCREIIPRFIQCVINFAWLVIGVM